MADDLLLRELEELKKRVLVLEAPIEIAAQNDVTLDRRLSAMQTGLLQAGGRPQ